MIIHNTKEERGFISKQDNYDILIKYSDESEKSRTLKFIIKQGNEIEISADMILEIIAHNFKGDIAQALIDSETLTIPTVDAIVPVFFQAPKDYKKGQIIQLQQKMSIPYFFMLAMESMELCKQNGDIIPVPVDYYEKAKKTLMEKNKEIAEKLFKPQMKSNDLLKQSLNSKSFKSLRDKSNKSKTIN